MKKKRSDGEQRRDWDQSKGACFSGGGNREDHGEQQSMIVNWIYCDAKEGCDNSGGNSVSRTSLAKQRLRFPVRKDLKASILFIFMSVNVQPVVNGSFRHPIKCIYSLHN